MELIEFEWSRCVDGYRLVHKLGDSDGPTIGIKAVSSQFERYRPLDIPALFARFAEAPASAKGMLQFCNRFGLPGGGRPDIAHAGDRATSAAIGSLLAHHARMRRAFVFFKNGDPSELVKCNNEYEGLVRTELRPEPDDRLGMVFVPSDLIRAMWLQFARHACSGARIFRCQRCNNPFEVGTGTNRRSTKKFCSNACKVAAFKASKKGTAAR